MYVDDFCEKKIQLFFLIRITSLKLKKIKSKVYVLIGDGELAEGSNFESLLFAAHNNLDNLVLIVDNNNLQSLTTVDKTLNLFPYDKKFEWGMVILVNQHNSDLIRDLINTNYEAVLKPN